MVHQLHNNGIEKTWHDTWKVIFVSKILNKYILSVTLGEPSYLSMYEGEM